MCDNLIKLLLDIGRQSLRLMICEDFKSLFLGLLTEALPAGFFPAFIITPLEELGSQSSRKCLRVCWLPMKSPSPLEARSEACGVSARKNFQNINRHA